MNDAKVTVVVPMYNVEEYVEKCLDSLINQTFKDIVIFAISDGSKDQSEDIAIKMSKRDHRIMVYSKENGGYGSVLQFAISKINTEYFIICDPDDWLENGAIEELYNSAIHHNTDITMANRFLVYIGEEKSKRIDSIDNTYSIEPNKIYTGEEKGKLSFFSVTPHAKLYRTDVCRDIIFPEKVSFTDFLLYIITLEKANSVIFIDRPLANYLLDRPGNSRTDRRPKVIQDHIIVFHSTLEQIKNENVYIKYRMYSEFLFILYKYTINSESIYEPCFIDQIDGIRKEVKSYYPVISEKISLSFTNKAKYILSTNSKTSMLLSIAFRRLLGNNH